MTNVILVIKFKKKPVKIHFSSGFDDPFYIPKINVYLNQLLSI